MKNVWDYYLQSAKEWNLCLKLAVRKDKRVVPNWVGGVGVGGEGKQNCKLSNQLRSQCKEIKMFQNIWIQKNFLSFQRNYSLCNFSFVDDTIVIKWNCEVSSNWKVIQEAHYKHSFKINSGPHWTTSKFLCLSSVSFWFNQDHSNLVETKTQISILINNIHL